MSRAVHGAVTRKVVRTPKATKPAAPSARAVPAAAAWSTPALLRLGLYAVTFTSLLFLAVVLMAAFSARDALRIMGRDTAPGILAAERIRGLLADMDRSAVAELLAKGAAPASFEVRRQQTEDAVMGAAETISYRDLERVPLQKLGLGLGSYTAQLQQARDELKSGDKRFIDAYRRAAHVMDADLVPAAVQLERSMDEVLEQNYARERQTLGKLVGLLVVASFLTGAVLLSLQLFLATRMRRVLNPLVFAATLVALFFAGYSIEAFQREGQEFASAKESGFDPEHALLQTRALAREASLAATRRQLDPAHFTALALSTPDEDIDQRITSSEQAFYSRIEAGFQDISGFEISAPAATLLTLILTFLGILPRLREFSA